MSMLETFNFRAMTNALVYAQHFGMIYRAASAAESKSGLSRDRMREVIVALKGIAAECQASAELDCKCMDYAFHLGPDDIDEFQKKMAEASAMETDQQLTTASRKMT